MQQYIYGNIGHKGYVYVSSEQSFFLDAKRAGVLTHLMNYDGYCTHGELTSQEHQCFWMVTTDLDIPGDPERLYLQVSGGEFHRGGFYVQGYMSDRGDGDLYGQRLLRLLRTRFHTLQQTMDAAEAGGLQPLGLEELPLDEALEPILVDTELLRNVLLALMQSKRVIIRLPSVGAAAMEQSRRLLLAIYERLPYAQRKTNGFITGASAAKLFDKVSALPAAVTLILMDGDADIAGIESDLYQKFYDLAAPEVTIPPIPRENRGKKIPSAALADYLAQQSPEELDEFFRFCQSYRKGAPLKLNEYLMLLDFFRIGQGQQIASLNMECETIEELLDLFQQLDGSGMEPDMVRRIKAQYAKRAADQGFTDLQILTCRGRLCKHAADPQDRELLTELLRGIPGLDAVPEGLPLKQITGRLNNLRELIKAGLIREDILFTPWGLRYGAEELDRLIKSFLSYRKGAPLPDMANPQVQKWVLENFGQEPELLLQLAKDAPGIRSFLIPRLAQKHRGITKADLRALYLAGCTKKQLCQGAGSQTCEAWARAAEDLFERWPGGIPAALQRPAEQPQWEGTGLILIDTALMALAALAPVAILLLTGGAGVLSWCILAGLQALGAGLCFGLSFAMPEKPQKKLMKWLSLSPLPGLVLALVMLAVSILF